MTRFGRWFVACTAGELLGFGAAALWAWLAFLLVGADPMAWSGRIATLGLMVCAGVVEGAVLGLFQWSALRTTFPKLRARSWLTATIAVAALGWLLGMLPSTLMGSASSGEAYAEPALAVILAGAAVFGALAGAAFGLAQWLVLRRHAHDARRWIWANSLGWALGLPWSYLAGSTISVSDSLLVAIIVGSIAGALMGASVALVTGRALARIRPLT
jgi:hypothetical protein